MRHRLTFIVKIILFILPVALIIVLLNRIIDPGLIFKANTYEDQLTDTLLANKNAIINTNFNSRIFERYLVNKLKHTPKTIILGSSKIMQLSKGFFCNDTIINNALSAGNLEDIVAIYGLYDKRNMTPKRVILNVEPNFFAVSTEPPLWADLTDEYVYMLNRLQLQPAKPIWMVKTEWQFNKLSNLYSFEYFKASVHRLAHNFKQKSESDKIIGTQAIYNSGITRLSDGSMTYNAAIRDQSPAVVMEAAITSAGKPIPGISNFKPDAYRVQLFEKFIEFLLAKHTEVILTITPYHPVIYKEILKNKVYSLVPENEVYIKSFAAKHHIFCYGSYNPEFTHTTNSDYLDSYHLKTTSLNRVLMPISGCKPVTVGNK